MKLKESGGYESLTPEEKQQLSSAAPEIRNSLASVVSSFRKKGKKIDLMTAAEQMLQVPHFQNDPNLKQFVSNNKLIGGLKTAAPKPDPFGLNKDVVAPPKWVGQSSSQQRGTLPPKSGNAPADEFEKMRTSKEGSKTSSVSGQPQETEFEKQLRRRKEKQQLGMAKTQPIRPVNESMVSGAANRVWSVISKMDMNDLMAIANMVNTLVNKQKGGMNTSQTSSTMTSSTMEHKQIVKNVVKDKLLECISARNTAHNLLTEGPLSNVWDKIKGAGTAVGQKMGLSGQMAQQAQNVGADERQKEAAKELTKLIGKANQMRQKFNAAILKNSNEMNAYHDVVMGASQAFEQYRNVLGPFGQQLHRQIEDAIHNLVYDLDSEKSQIDTFLDTLKKQGVDVSTSKQNTKKKNDARRAQEEPGAVPASKRLMPLSSAGINPKLQSGTGKGRDEVNKKKALALHQTAERTNSPELKQKAMNDLQKLFLQQIEQDKKKKGTKSKK